MNETAKPSMPSTCRRVQLLADFRHHLRLFLQFSEEAAGRFELEPQQHQLLLQIAGAPDDVEPTVGYATQRLGLRHHTVVGLSKRCEAVGLLTRKQSEDDRRKVVLELTRKGHRILAALSHDHARELTELAPKLIKTLANLSSSAQKAVKDATEGNK
jgi:DNA-binding MarR family transcriptional regulator